MNKADDYKVALDIASRLCATNNDPGKWEGIVERLQEVMSADAVQLAFICTRNKKSIFSVETGQRLPPLMQWAGVNEVSIRDAVSLSQSVGEYRTIDMHFAFLDKEWDTSYPLLRQGAGAGRMEHAFLCADRFPELDIMVILGITRNDKAERFGADDITFLGLIKDALHQSMYTFASFFIKQLHIQSMRAMIDRSRVGLIMVDSAGHSLVCNEKAEELLERNQVFDMNNHGYFHLQNDILHREFKNYLGRPKEKRAYNCGIDELYLRIEPEKNTNGYLLVVCPMEANLHLPVTCDASQQGLYLLQIIDFSDQWSLDPAALQRALDITAAEAEVLKCLSEGASLREIAGSKDRSYHTIRNHLQKVMNKTGLHRQADLMLLVHSVVSAGAAKGQEDLKTDIA